MKVLFAAAGTAGHVNPAIAMAQILEKRYPMSRFLFLVTPNGMEKRLIDQAGYETVTVDVRGIQRKLSLSNIHALRLSLSATRFVRHLIRRWNPDLIIGTGGYMSYPAVIAGHKENIPCVLHESNAVPGLAVRLLSRKACMVLGGFPTIRKKLPRKCNFYCVGTPVRNEFKRISRVDARASMQLQDGDFLIVTVGGSLGAQMLNKTAIDCFKKLSVGRKNFFMVLSTGKRYFNECIEYARNATGELRNLKILPYVEDMATVLAAADLVISRGGAATITELTATAAPSIIIPYPAATNDHQTKNARALEKIGACLVITEKELTAECLTKSIFELADHPEQLRRMRYNARHFQPQDIDEKLVEWISSILI